MRLSRLLALVALALPCLSFAAPACDSSDATRAYWTKQGRSFTAHGAAALRRGDNVDAEASLGAAKKAAELACIAKPSKAAIALAHGVTSMKIDGAMLAAAKMVAKSQYGQAFELLSDIAEYASEAGAKLPDGHPLLLHTVNTHRVEDFFVGLDKAVASGRFTPEQAAQREKDVCVRGIPQLKIGVPERCKKYSGTK